MIRVPLSREGPRRLWAALAPVAAIAAVGLASGTIAAQETVASIAVPAAASSTPSFDPGDLVALHLAAAWDVPVSDVRLELPHDAPPLVDSVAVTEGSGDRWVVSFWAGSDFVRRFVRVGRVVTLPVAAADLPRGYALGPDDVSLVDGVAWGPPPRPARSARESRPSAAGVSSLGSDPVIPPVGWITQRRVRTGETLESPTVRPPLLVRGGDTVEAVLVRDGVTLTVRAEALGSGRAGERVAVRMPSGVRMEGRVVKAGVVTLESGEVP